MYICINQNLADGSTGLLVMTTLALFGGHHVLNHKYLGLKEENPSLLEETERGARLDIGWPAVRILG